MLIERDDISQRLSLADSSKYICYHAVPVFDEHTVKNERGQVVHRFGRDRLIRLADNANRFEQETGKPIRVIVGHDNSGPHVGYARGFRVGPLWKAGRRAVLCELYIKREHDDKAERFPRRSICLQEQDDVIEHVALLGARTPARDLGLLTQYRRTDRRPENRSTRDEVSLYARMAVAEDEARRMANTLDAANAVKERNSMPEINQNKGQGAMTKTERDQLLEVASRTGKTFEEVSAHRIGMKNFGESAGFANRLAPGKAADWKPTGDDKGDLHKFFDSAEYSAAVRNPSAYPKFVTDPWGFYEDWRKAPKNSVEAVQATMVNPGRPDGNVRYARGAAEGSGKYSRATYDQALRVAQTDPAILRLPAENRFDAALRRVVDGE